MVPQLSVLGPVTVVRDGRAQPLGATRESALLSNLIVHRGEVVSAARLIDDLWRGDPPPGSWSTLQTYVRNLRRLLDPGRVPGAPSRVLVTRPPGYLLDVGRAEVDAGRFERIVEEARGERAASRDAAAANRYRKALGLWRGSAYAEWAEEPCIRPEVARLEEGRLVAHEELAEVELALGDHDRLCGALQALVAANPLRERLWGQWMVALYRSGRQADALDAYQQLRRLLGEELGIEPGEAIRRLEADILLHRPDLDWGGVDREAPAARSSPTRRRLDASLTLTTTFVGRDDDVSQLLQALERGARLLTVIGPGGVGKTRLALHASTGAEGFPGGTWFVDLAALIEPEDVPDAVLAALGGGRGPGRSVLDAIGDVVAGQRLLVVLDNCEHVLDAAAECVEAIIRNSNGVVVTTSRAPLALPGEQLFPIRPLALDAAVRLFCDRAGAADPTFRLERTDRDVVASICRHLDVLPLAIELAAARVRSLKVTEIAHHLDQRFRLLADERRGGINPHPSLQAAVRWSYDLLNGEEQEVLAVLSVFLGDFGADAVAALCPDRLDELGAINVLDRLVSRSMVVAERAGATTRYSLLETIRRFASELPTAQRELAALRKRHARHFLGVAEQARVLQTTREAAAAASLVDAEWANLRLAFDWLASTEDASGALRLIAALHWFRAQSSRQEVLHWAERAIALEGAREDPLWPAAAAVASLLRRDLGDVEGAEEIASEARREERVRRLPRSFGPAFALWAVSWRRDPGRAEALVPEVERIAEATGNPLEVGAARYIRVMTDVLAGADGVEARARAATREAEATGNPVHLAYAHACTVALESQRDLTAAVDAFRHVERWCAGTGHELILGNAALWIALEVIDADPVEALRFARIALLGSKRSGYRGNLDLSLTAVLLPLVGFRRFRTAALLLGGLSAQPLGDERRPEVVERTEAAVAAALGSEAASLRYEGERLDTAALVELALTEIDGLLDAEPGFA